MITLGSVQSCYIPWRGYFDIIRRSDIFVFHDDIQYTKQDWRNRNRIRTPTGPIWLTVPVRKETTGGTIDEVVIDSAQDWGLQHWRKITANYERAAHFNDCAPALKDVLLSGETRLSVLNIRAIRLICDMIQIRTRMIESRSLGLTGRRTDRLIAMCRAVGATRYLSGPSAQSYLEPEKFAENGIELAYIDYRYPEYPQQLDGFLDHMSIVDLLLNCGSDCLKYF
jgi:hypothetical protein